MRGNLFNTLVRKSSLTWNLHHLETNAIYNKIQFLSQFPSKLATSRLHHNITLAMKFLGNHLAAINAFPVLIESRLINGARLTCRCLNSSNFDTEKLLLEKKGFVEKACVCA